MHDQVVSLGSNSISISVEALAAESYPDLIKARRAGKKYQPVVGNERAISVSYKDLLVVTRFHGRPFGPVASAIDKRLGGSLEQAVENSSFRARQGETMIFELEARGLGSGNARRILVIGLGDPALCGQFVYCGLIGCVIEECINLEPEQVILLLNDLQDNNIRVQEENFARVLSCRVAHHLSTQAEHGHLKKIRLVVAPDVKDRVEASFTARQSVCQICSNPNL
ncbi:MAG: M17 family peptidase N-terminal domain-containing protein [Candidatus Melainabacteria bacterium]|nr:M17 family peptidase N-terminal domain-containing protein [Candidatus Melainabacteria bacterium]